MQEAERREKSAGHRRGKKSGAGVKALPLEQNSSPLGDGSPCKGHAVTAADRESTPGSWQKTGRSKPDAFYARPPPALGAGVGNFKAMAGAACGSAVIAFLWLCVVKL